MTLISNNSNNTTNKDTVIDILESSNEELRKDIDALKKQINELKTQLQECDREHAETLAHYEMMKLYVFAARDVSAQEYGYQKAPGALQATFMLLKLATETRSFYAGNLGKTIEFPPDEDADDFLDDDDCYDCYDDDCYDCYDDDDDDEIPF